jgi:hypothetical protein
MTKEIKVTQYDLEACFFILKLKYYGNIEIKVNGKAVYTANSATVKEESITLNDSQIAAFVKGTNTVQVTCSGGTNYVDVALKVSVSSDSTAVLTKGQTGSMLPPPPAVIGTVKTTMMHPGHLPRHPLVTVSVAPTVHGPEIPSICVLNSM